MSPDVSRPTTRRFWDDEVFRDPWFWAVEFCLFVMVVAFVWAGMVGA